MNKYSMAGELGRRILDDARRLAASTPTDTKRIISYTQQLAAYAQSLESKSHYDPRKHELIEKKMCVWKEALDPAHGDPVYETTCGDAFVFGGDGPFKNGFKHCPFCGRTLTEEPISPITRGKSS